MSYDSLSYRRSQQDTNVTTAEREFFLKNARVLTHLSLIIRSSLKLFHVTGSKDKEEITRGKRTSCGAFVNHLLALLQVVFLTF